MLTIADLQVYIIITTQKPSQAFGDDNCFKNSTTDPIIHCGL